MRKHLRHDESGIALLTVLLVVMLASALMAGLFAAVVSDQRSQGFDRDQSQAYSAAHAGLEKLTTQVAQLFVTDFSPSAAQLTTASAIAPSISGFSYVAPGGGPGYSVTFNADTVPGPNYGNPLPSPSNDITTGPFAGFKGLITPYTLTVTARSTGGGSEVRLRRDLQTVAVPVFQFGIFGEKSLSFHAGADFDFGGRVHTNQHLFLAEGTGATLTFRDKLTAVGEVVRSVLENTYPITSSGHTGDVSIPTVIGSSYRDLLATEGSVTGNPGAGQVPYSGWKNLSEATYNTNVRTTLTGAKRLDLPLVSQGAAPIDLIKRPDVLSNENTANAVVFGQRYFAQASLRILLSDRQTDLTGLPTITAGAPLGLDPNGVNPFVPAAGMPPLATSVGPNSVAFTAPTAGPTTNGTLTVTGNTPAWLKMPAAMTGAAGVAIGPGVVKNCIAMTATAMTCDVATNTIPYNRAFTVTLDANVGGGTIALMTGNAGTFTVGSARTINLVSTRGLALASRVVWIGNSPVTCAGYTATTLTGCAWTTTPATANPISTNAVAAAGQALLGGFIKIEKQNNATPPVWSDVTAEILNLGFTAQNQEGSSTICDPTPNAVIRIQRLRDNGTPLVACGYGGTLLATDFWPNVLYDAREGSYRDVTTVAAMNMGGVMNYVSIDMANLKRWFNGTIPGGVTGNQALNNNGYIVYFSDRRGNHDPLSIVAVNAETGEYGNEDSINQAAGGASSAPNGGMPEAGEDRNEVNGLQTYGAVVSAIPGVVGALPVGAVPFGTLATPLTPLANYVQARVNRQVLFRRALKVTNGGINAGVNNLPDSGILIASENGVYVQGNFNATSTDVEAEPNRPAAILGDAITILSNNWSDAKSLNFPNDMAARDAIDTGYRFAMVGGKSIAFPRPGWATAGDTGTDGGVHNFMRMLEDWGGQTTRYRGSMVSLYTARQMIGIYKANSNVYAPGTRAFAFDTDFLQPTLLPPGTPMFRDVNTLRFRQILRPNQ